MLNNFPDKDMFCKDLERVLNNTYPSNWQVKVRNNTPKILLKANINDLPMLITQKHIKSIIYSLDEARRLKLRTKNINYHGIGKELFLKIIYNLDNANAVYKKDDKNYIIVTDFKDSRNREIIVPIQVNGKGLYNNKYIEENQIKSIYGRNNLKKYLKINKFEQIYKKKHLP